MMTGSPVFVILSVELVNTATIEQLSPIHFPWRSADRGERRQDRQVSNWKIITLNM